MKHTLSLLAVLSLAGSAVAYAGDVTVKAVVTTGPEDDPVTSFTADAPKLWAIFKTKGITNGDKVRGALIAEDVGDVAPPIPKCSRKH